jgi:peptidyl-prolyl cis-trans isomerase D
MMRTMRASARWLMLILAIAFVGWMVFEVGMDVSGQSGMGPASELLSINGRKVDQQTFYQAVRNAQELQRQQGLPAAITLEDQRALENAVVDELVQQALLEAEYRRRGIGVTDEEVRQGILNAPFPDIQQIDAFHDENGQFDIEKYRRYLTAGADPNFALALEARYRSEIPMNKLLARIVADVTVSEERLWQAYGDRTDSATASVVAIVPSALIPDAELEVTEEELERYYRANRDDFEQPEGAYLSYVELPRIPNASDSAAAFQRIEQLREEIRSGTDFAAVAQRESADSGSRTVGGDLGEQPVGTFVPEFEEAAMTLRPGQMSGPVLTPFGYHLIRLESRTSTTIHARHILIPIELQGDHLEYVDARADTLDLIAADQDDPQVLDDAAAEMGLTVLSAGRVLKGERARVAGLPVPDAGVWAFEAIIGQTSQVIEAPEAYYVFRLDSIEDAGVPRLDDVRTLVAREVRLEKKEARARAVADSLRMDVDAGMELEEAARRRNLAVRQIGPMTRINPGPVLRDAPEAIGAAFGLPVGEVGGPFESDFGIFFVRPLERNEAERSAFDAEKELLRTQLTQQEQQARIQLFLAALREEADVIDRREELIKLAREQPALPFGATSPLGF